MNNLLLILGIIALSNGNISLFDNKEKNKKINKKVSNNQIRYVDPMKKLDKKKSKHKKRKKSKDNNDIFKFNLEDINKSLNLMELSEEDLDRGMEIITRTKKYMDKDERKMLIKVESILDLVKGIKKLSNINEIESEYETDFFRSMDEEDKKNMMIKEILEVFPEKRKESVEKAIDMKKKIDLLVELFLPDDFGEGGFSLSSLANLNNLGSINNLQLLGSLLRGDEENNSQKPSKVENEEYEEDNYKYYYEEDYDDIDYD